MYNLEEIIQNTSGIRLLYVEDNEQTRIPTLSVLSEFFQDIVVCVDGQDTLNKYKENRVQDHCGGKISCFNTQEGACFKMELPNA